MRKHKPKSKLQAPSNSNSGKCSNGSSKNMPSSSSTMKLPPLANKPTRTKNGAINGNMMHRTFTDLPMEIIQNIFSFQPYLEIIIAERYAFGNDNRGCLGLAERSRKIIFSHCDEHLIHNYSHFLFCQVFGKCKYYLYSSTMYDQCFPLTNRLVMIYPNIKICTVEIENSMDDFYFTYFFQRRLMDDLFLQVALTKMQKLMFANAYKKRKNCGGSTMTTMRFLRDTLMKNFKNPCGRALISFDMGNIMLRENYLDLLQILWEGFTSHEVIVNDYLKEGYLSRFESKESENSVDFESNKPTLDKETNTLTCRTLSQYLEYLQSTIISIMLNENKDQIFNKSVEKIDLQSFFEKLPLLNHTVNFNLFHTMKSNYFALSFRSTIVSLSYFEKKLQNNTQQSQRREKVFQMFTCFPNLTKLTFVVDSQTEPLDETVKLFQKYLPNLKQIDLRGGLHSRTSLNMLLRGFPKMTSVVLYLSLRTYPKQSNNEHHSSNGYAYAYSPSVGVGVPFLNDIGDKLKCIQVQPNPASKLSIVFDRETFLKQIVNKKIQSLKGDFIMAGGAEKLLPLSSLYKLVLFKPNYNMFEKYDFLKVISQTKTLRILYIHESLLGWRPKGYKPTVEFFQNELEEFNTDNEGWKQKFKIFCKKEKTPFKRLLLDGKSLLKVKIFYKSIRNLCETQGREELYHLEKLLIDLFSQYISHKYKNIRFLMTPVCD
ncbi:hypothetical protein FDP41_005827 [Naegleria fowleri]|uniref:Uncharacterized protein n=1 Tax=Naegleria fowleri TaxID=5763 RepID=A0A6A5BLY1_NAEFO|nr:uncharacterized protein FDP41_005827 [Naegleria fowleri]KAF0975074.1 hypothetical protein FDP41_005827 [Naegleria fowleri]CAG4709523.1 unnamed protein product [Naegleria fowleri]